MAADKKEAKKVAPAAGEPDEGKQKKKKLIMMVGGGLLLVLVSVGGTLGAMKFLSPHPSASAETAASAPAVEEELEVAENAAIYYVLKPNFTVNYDVNGRQRFLQTELTFTYRNPALLPILELHMPAVRNSLVLLLSSQVFDDLQTPEGKEKLREDALEVVQEILDQEQMDTVSRMPSKERAKFEKEHGNDDIPNIEQVLFTNFVMQ